MSYNACGDCTACCERFTIEGDIWEDGIKKKNVLCKYNCNGCTIYEDRPKICQDFKCVWLRIKEARPDFCESMRPDNVGAIVLTKEPEDGHGQMLFDETAPDSFAIGRKMLSFEQNRLVSEVTALANRQEIPTVLLYRTYDWKLKKINIQMEQTLT